MKPKKILIIEDDQLVANIYRNKLAVEGFSVEVANSGEAGLEILAEFHPDLLILDLILPNLSGLDLMKQLRANPEFQKLPIIVFSNTYLSTLVQDAWKAGATKCLSKANCSPKEVIEAVRSTLSLNPESAKSKAPPLQPRLTAAVGANTPVPASREKRNSFSKAFPDTLLLLRQAITNLTKAATKAERSNYTQELYQRIHILMGAAHLDSLPEFAQLTEVLEAMVLELHQATNPVSPSTYRTLASAIDFLPVLFDHPAAKENTPIASQSKILVVDDEPIARRAVTHALERAKLKAVGVDDPNVALKMLHDSNYDLVFLDVDMPGMTGHELCTRLRALPRHKTTPVVFVTNLNDFQNRANSMMSGGNDFISKPFPFLELALKSLVYVLRGKYQPAKLPATPQPAGLPA